MDFTYSPHQEAGGTLHLPSPTPKSHVDSFTASVNNLRRSLSRSPSKPSRLQVCASTPHGSPGSTLSPFALTRTQCQKSPCGHSNHGSFASGSPGGDQTSIPPKKKFSLRRSTAALRSSPRAAASPRSSMRRVLSDSSNQGNVTPSISRRSSGEENKSDENYSPIPKQQTDHKPPVFRFDVNDGPIKFEFARPKQETLIVTSESEPMRSSPLKRGDGQMNFGEAILGAPVKRRSLHAAVGFGADADVFSQPSSPLNLNSPTTHVRESDQNRDRETRDGDLPFEQEQDHLRDRFLERESNFSSFSSPAVKRTSSLRKALHRQTPIFSRSRGFADSSHESFSQGSPALQPRNRMSLDSSYFGAQTGSRSALSPFLTKSSSNSSSPLFPHTHLSQLRNSTHQPHPLSKTLIPSSSASTTSEDSIMAPAPFPESHNDSNEPINAYQQFPDLSKSLPVGSMRPTEVAGQTIDEFSFATPLAPKAIRRSVMSTGLISKTSKPWGYNPYNCDEERFAMPDTPSKLAPTTKRASFPPDAASPFRTSLTNRIAPSYGDNTPANDHSSHPTFNVSTAIGYHYGNELERRSTFGSNDSDEHINQQEFQSSSADEMPPTPTKPAGSGRFKQNSLRSNIFGRRPSLAPDTFSAPDNDFEDVQSPRLIRKVTPINQIASGRASPHTPDGSFAAPDPSSLSISGIKTKVHTNDPATPTAQRDHGFRFGASHFDVDDEIRKKFSTAVMIGHGEFSVVYRVEGPRGDAYGSDASLLGPADPKVWVIKKCMKPYIGVRDRNRKANEAIILDQLRNREHIVEFVSSFETPENQLSRHLYIQTEFCSQGNLKEFVMEAGHNCRLDDFRVWKILFELCLGVREVHDAGIIHLDLKPANVFIAWDGTLKLGDFGLATHLPAPPDHEGEGDREYIGPEILQGRFEKPGDIFSLGMIVFEIASNAYLPNGDEKWRSFRTGDFDKWATLTWHPDSHIERDDCGIPLVVYVATGDGQEKIAKAPVYPRNPRPSQPRVLELTNPPAFMADENHPDSLDNIVHWMLQPNPDMRPTVEQLINSPALRWIAYRRRAGAVIFEGNWGPALTTAENVPDLALGPYGPPLPRPPPQAAAVANDVHMDAVG